MASLLLLCCLSALALTAHGVTQCPAELNSATVCEGAFEPGKCPDGYMYKENYLDLGCSLCPSCVKFRGFNDTCLEEGEAPANSLYSVTMSSGRALVSVSTCGPGLVCNSTDGRCQAAENTTACLQALSDYMTADKPKSYVFPPTCQPDGTYAPIQCKGLGPSGICFCVTSDGTRIFGRDLHSNVDKMSCACSQKFWELKQAGRKDVTLHCLPNGNFEPLQCDQDVCFCVNSTTAEPYGGTVSRHQWAGLPCYEPRHFPGGYDRMCESMNRASREVAVLLASHGVQDANFSIQCDPDGSYYPTSCSGSNQRCICMDRAGNAIPGYSVDGSHTDSLDMNCRCARDHNDNDPIAYSLRNVKCSANGNYNPEQCDDDRCYCVDPWGAPDSLPVSINIPGVKHQIRCCLKCLARGKLDCSKPEQYAKYCPEDVPDWSSNAPRPATTGVSSGPGAELSKSRDSEDAEE